MTTTRDHTPEPAALAVLPAAAIPAPLPMFGGDQMRQAFTAYQALQRTLDEAMPDQILRIEDRAFRKKGYWRAIAVAFNLTVEPIDERRAVDGIFEDGRENFGWLVVYKAMTMGGRIATGDGACFAIEKASRRNPAQRWAHVPAQASEHNVRSHAHTRAFNRAVSNLVGFGEVSAEEIERDDAPASERNGARVITRPQQTRFFTLARKAGWTTDGIRAALFDQFGIRDTAAITQDRYDAICRVFEQSPADVPAGDNDPAL